MAGGTVLAEVDIHGDLRMILDGHEPHESGVTVGRVYSQASTAKPSELGIEATADSTGAVRYPSLSIDDEGLHSAVVWCARGASPAVVIAAHDVDALPRLVLRALVAEAALAMVPRRTGATSFKNVKDIAERIRNGGIWVLKRRIRAVEQSVRDALADDELTEVDYVALREYPQRLAKIERMASGIRSPAPTWEAIKQPVDPRYIPVMPEPIAIDNFHKWAGEVEADAKQAVSRISGLVATQQVAMGARQRLDFERLQGTVTVVGAAVLVPGMVAAAFGANVDFPGEGTRSGFWAMILLMLAGGLGSYAALRAVQQRENITPATWDIAFAATALLVAAIFVLAYA